MVLNRSQQIIISVIIAIIISIAMRFIIYKYTGWIKFEMTKGQNFMPTKNIGNIGNISNIRFKNCTYTIVGKDGTKHEGDVTAALNRMTIAFTDKNNKDFVFKLADPGLSTNSFQIEGYNDNNSTRNVANWDAPEATAVLTGFYKFIK